MPLEANDGTGHEMLHMEPIAAVVDGDFSCAIVRNVLTPSECARILLRMEQEQILIAGREGISFLRTLYCM